MNRDTLVYTSEDDIIWVELSRCILSLSEDLYICLCYVTPDESSRQSLIETNMFDRLFDSMVSIESKAQNKCHLVACGIPTL